MAIARYIWFYYKNVSVLSIKHVNKVINSIIIPNLFILFFHWSFQIREIFYHFLIYIINFKIKNLIKPHKNKEKIEKSPNIFGFVNIGIFGFRNKDEDCKEEVKDKVKEEDINNNINGEKKYFYFLEIYWMKKWK